MAAPLQAAPKIECIAVGASAGGVQALSELLPALPADLRAIVLVVLHVPSNRPSLLTRVLGARCRLPVVEAEDKMPLEPGRIYVAPPDYHLLVEAGPAAALSRDSHVKYSRPSIDVLFESAAEVFGPGLAGIVLSGANDDGADGLAAIHRQGGATAVQDPAEAEAAEMPRSAFCRVPNAAVLPVADIAKWLMPRLAVCDGKQV